MASKDKVARDAQKAYWEGVLSRRLKVLGESGFEPEQILKDPSIKMMRAELRKVGARLRAIEKKERKIEEMAKIKAEKLSVAKEKKTKKAKPADETQTVSKRQQKIEKKLEKKQGKKQEKEVNKG